MLSSDVQDELEVLESIHGDDFTTLAPVWSYPCFQIRCRPTVSELSNDDANEGIFLTVKFTFSAQYPKAPPKIDAVTSKGLPPDAVQKIMSKINDKAKEFAGGVMVHDIVVFCKSLIDSHRHRDKQPVSFYDVMKEREDREQLALQTLRTSGTPNSATHIQKDSKSYTQKPIADSIQKSSLIKTSTKDDSTSPLRIPKAIKEDDTGDMMLNISTIPQTNLISKKSKDLSVESDSDISEERGVEDEFSSLNEKSRYKSEFITLERLGKGASGEVWKVKNRLDRRQYAVKKVNLDSKDRILNKKIRREVTTISRLFHKHVVRYYAAWIEIELSSEDKSHLRTASPSNQESASKSMSAEFTGSASSEYESEIAFTRLQNDEEFSSDGFTFEYNDDDDDDDESDESSEEDDDEEENDENEYSSDKSSKSLSPKPVGKNKTSQLMAPATKRYLFIQMEYCPKTLRDLIDEETLWQRPQDIFLLLRQMLEGLEYIHKRGLLHRDLKPANIFLDSENNIKIGDFGLAKFSLKPDLRSTYEHNSDVSRFNGSAIEMNDKNLAKVNSGLTDGVGTAIYRAPEQASGKRDSSSTYNDKADLFSLGIILFEMCHKPFSTGMERILEINDIREQEKFDDGFKNFLMQQSPNLLEILKLLIQRDMTKRPSAHDILQSTLLPPRIDIDADYMKEIQNVLLRPNNSEAALQVVNTLFRRKLPDRLNIDGLSIDSMFDMDYISRQYKRMQPYKIGIISPESTYYYKSIKGHDITEKESTYTFALPYHIFSSVHDILSKALHSRGVMKLSPSLYQLAPMSSSCSPAFLDRNGNFVFLPTNLITPLARLAYTLNLQSAQFYDIDSVYSNIQESPTQSEYPRRYTELAYGILHNLSSFENANEPAAVICHVECLLTLTTLLRGLDSYIPHILIRVANGDILKSIFDICDLTESYDKTVQRVSETKNNSTSSHQREVLKRLFSSMCSDFSSSPWEELQQAFQYSCQNLLISDSISDQLLPYLKILWEVNSTPISNPMNTLTLIEQEFYKSPIIGIIQKKLAGTETASKTTQVTSNTLSTRTQPTTPPSNISASNKNVVKQEIDISLIGRKKIIPKQSVANNVQKENQSTPTTKISGQSNSVSNEDEKDENIVKLQKILNEFDNAIDNMKEILSRYQILSNISPLIASNISVIRTYLHSKNSQLTTTQNVSNHVEIRFELGISLSSSSPFSTEGFCFSAEPKVLSIPTSSLHGKAKKNKIKNTVSEHIFEGGEFTRLFLSCKEWISSGFHAKLEQLVSIILKHEDHLVNTMNDAENKQVLSHYRNKINLSIAEKVISNEIPHVIVLTQSHDSIQRDLKPVDNSSSKLKSKSSIWEQLIIEILHQNNIRASNKYQDMIFGINTSTQRNQLTSLMSKISLCHRYGVPVVILLPIDNGDNDPLKLYTRINLSNISQIKRIMSKDGGISCSLEEIVSQVKYLLQLQSVYEDGSPDAPSASPIPNPHTLASVSKSGHNKALQSGPSSTIVTNNSSGNIRTIYLSVVDSGQQNDRGGGKNFNNNINVKTKKIRTVELQVYNHFTSSVVSQSLGKSIDLKIITIPSLALLSSATENELFRNFPDYRVIASDIPYLQLRGFSTNLSKYLASLNASTTTSSSSTMLTTAKDNSAQNDFKAFIASHPMRRQLRFIIQDIASCRSTSSGVATSGAGSSTVNIPYAHKRELLSVYLYSTIDDMTDLLTVDVVMVDICKASLDKS